eukprot:Gb_14259 [translate_table: standard]
MAFRESSIICLLVLVSLLPSKVEDPLSSSKKLVISLSLLTLEFPLLLPKGDSSIICLPFLVSLLPSKDEDPLSGSKKLVINLPLLTSELPLLGTSFGSGGNKHSECYVTEPSQVDGPSTPMRYIPRPKYAPTEIPETADCFSCSLATGLSYTVEKELEQKEKSTEFNTASASKGLTYQRHYPMKLNQPASTLKNSQRRIMAEVKQKQPELHKENMLSLSLSKPERVKESVHRAFGTLARTNVSNTEDIDMQYKNLYEQVSSQAHISPACNSVNMADNLQSSRSMPGNFCSAMCLSWHLKTEQHNACVDNQQEPQTTGSAQATPMSASKGPCAPWRPVTHTFSVLQCENTIQGSSSRLQYNVPELIVSTPVVFNAHMESLNHMPILETPLKANGDGHGIVSDESNLCLRYNDSSMSGKKKKSGTYIKQETEPEPSALESHGNGAINSSVSMEHLCLSRPELQRQSESRSGEVSATLLSLEGATSEALPNQSNIGNTIAVQSFDCHCQSIGLSLLAFPANSPMPATFSTFSSGGPSLPQSTEDQRKAVDSHLGDKKSTTQRLSSTESDWGKFLALSTAQVDQSKKETLKPYQQRFITLQAFLKQCDEPDEYLQTIRTLSATARSGHAFELETRAVMLSLEEGKELHRMKMLNVFGKAFQGSANDAGAIPQGPHVPAPGTAKTLKLVIG